MSDTPQKHRVAITVDVEAHPIRAAEDHVNRLIWGRQNGREAGIRTMMDIADRHGVPLTFFLDYPEAELYGEDLLDVGREILRRGHDLEPHCHVEYLMERLFGLDDEWAIRLPKATYAQSEKIISYLREKHAAVTGQNPLAYRSGAYLIGPEYLKALHDGGIRLDASYHPLFAENPFPWGLRGPFLWQNGLWEIPIPSIPYFYRHNHLVPWNFNHAGFLGCSQKDFLQKHKDFLDTWFRRNGDTAVATLIMHSWSFWKIDPRGYFTCPADENITRFEELIAMLKGDYEFVALGELAKAPPPKDSLETVNFSEQTGYCPVCYEPVSHFRDYNAPKRQCAFCRSVERQRTLVDLVYTGAFGPQFFFSKKVLHIAPGWPEKLLLRRMSQCDTTTLNILPGCDMQADIQHMPEVADNTFDIVLASEVFRHVKNLDAALKEIARVLRPGGLLLCFDCLENADYGHEITDEAEQISWYGKEKLDAYGIGDFRRFGRKDWEEAFKPYFYTRIFKADDKATGSPAWWLAAAPRKGGSDTFTAAILRSNAGRILHDAQTNPVCDFIPDFSTWQRFRAQIAARGQGTSRLEQLKKAIFALQFLPLDESLPTKLDSPDFLADYPSTVHPFVAQSWFHLLRDVFVDPMSGDTESLDHIICEIDRWLAAYGFYASSSTMTSHTRWMVWHDTATASRLVIMAYALLRAADLPAYDDARYERLFRAMLDHYLLLCADHFFTRHYNHGLLQLLGLLAFSCAWPCCGGTAAVQAFALERLQNLLERMSSPEGIVREHSTEYHAVILPWLIQINHFFTKKSSRQFLQTHITAIRSTFVHFIRPDGSLAPFGDTPPNISPIIREEAAHARASSAKLSGLTLFPQSGYAFLRIRPRKAPPENASWLALQGAFHSLTHKHCDDLACTWSEGKQNILVDSGQQYGFEGMLYSGPLWEKGFYYSVPNRVYSESVHAHNCVEINGETYSRRIPPYGALPLYGRQLSETCWLLKGEWQRPEGFRQVRRLVFSPARWLLIMDELDPLPAHTPGETRFSQWFHLDASLNLLSCEQDSACAILPDKRGLYCQSLDHGELSCHKGEFTPRLQGWQATENIYQLEPAWALGVHQSGSRASFRTLFSLIGPCEEIKSHDGSCELRFADGAVDGFSLTERQKDEQ